MRLVLKLLVVVIALGSMQSCVSKKKFDELMASKAAADAALAQTQSQLKTLQDEKNALAAQMEAEKARMNGEMTSLRNDLNATKGQVAQVQEKLNMTQAELDKLKTEINGIFATYSNSGLSLEDRGGRLYVITDPIQYRSGSYNLSRAERDAIDKLAETLKANPNLKILVEGHTDNVKVNAGSGLGDNWQLSSMRALNVVRRLVKGGVNPNQVAAVGRGDSMPAADNATREGKAANRRTVVVPDADLKGIMDAVKKN